MNDKMETEWLVREGAPDLHLTVAGDRDAKATIILVHGIGWHAGFYVDLMSRLRKERLRVVAIDLRGHGKSTGDRGLHTYEELLEDVLDVVDDAIRKYGTEVYLFGTSFGASVAYYAAVREMRHSDARSTEPARAVRQKSACVAAVKRLQSRESGCWAGVLLFLSAFPEGKRRV